MGRLGSSHSFNQRIFMNLYETSVFIAEFERKDLYSYYGVNEDNIKNKTERYSALIKGIVFLTNKGGVL